MYCPNGDLAPNNVPCEDSIENSLCCGQGYARLTKDIFQAIRDDLQKPGATESVRGSCTDKTFRSLGCRSVCLQVQVYPRVENTAGEMGTGKCQGTDED